MSLSFLVYDIIIRVYAILIRVASFYNHKAHQWIHGRKSWYATLERSLPEHGADIWMHCASLGEFEQGRPVIEALRKTHPDQYILLTFFSPSGYEIRKNYTIADHICYLPLDTKENARRFTDLVKPRLVIFVKYEFWLYFLTELHQRKIPTVLISAIFRSNQFFFRWYGKAFLPCLFFYKKIFVQNENSAMLLQKAGVSEAVITGDTRFDRVIQVAMQSKEIPALEVFLQGKQTWVAGSTWPDDEHLIQSYYHLIPKWVIAPHEVDEAHMLQIEKLFPGKTVRYSILTTAPEQFADKAVLLIDNVGMLSSLYRYGSVAYIGGGFGHGIHNILEAAVYGIPVVFGPKYHKFKEAVDLVDLDAACSISNKRELKATIATLKTGIIRKEKGNLCSAYVEKRKGATEQIVHYITSYLIQ